MRATLTSRRAVAIAIVGIASALSTNRAEAREHARLRFVRANSAETCPAEEELRSAVIARLGYDPFEGDEGSRLDVRFVRSSDGFAVRITRGDDAGGGAGRELKSARCGDLLAPTAIALSIAIDPLASATTSSESPSELPALPPPTNAPAPPPPAPHIERSPLAEPQEPWRLVLDLGTHLAVGSAPSPATGASIGAGARRGAFSVLVEGRADLAGSTHAGGGKVSAQLLAASLVPCVHRAILMACAIGSFGSVLGEGLEVPKPTRDSSLYAAFGARLGLEVPLNEWLLVGLRGNVVAAPTRTVLRLNGVDAWTAPLVHVTAGIGVGAIFR